MDESRDGVVYFSLGTAATLESFPNETVSSIYSSFAKFAPIRFLIKTTEGKSLPPGLPKNAKTMTWIPQIAVLSILLIHNVKYLIKITKPTFPDYAYAP